MVNRRSFVLVLKDSGIGEVGGRPDAHLVPAERGHGRAVDQCRPHIRVCDSDTGKACAASRFSPTSDGVKDWLVVALATSRTKPYRFSHVVFGVKTVVLSSENS